jgi:hypothetical protein|tara:strand:+ start:4350 stop:4859 length:510 start_codon:yes stop_codon:yes gene_type:complete
MAGFSTKTFIKHDDYMTPKYAWENIKDYIPKDKVIWEAFYGDGASGDYLIELGCKEVIHQPVDFFENDLGEVIISNPPYSKSKDVISRLKHLDKPFILIMPTPKICTSYFRDNFKDSNDPIQIIIPRKRIHFLKHIDGKPVEGWSDRCNFDCFYYCYKMNLPRDIVWLE